MPYLHCHTKDCGWSQDDFWSIGGWNPITAVKRNDHEENLFKEKVYLDRNTFEDINKYLPEPLPYWKDEQGWYTKGQYLQAHHFYQLYQRCMSMNVKTYEEWKQVKDTWKCPKCGQHHPDID